MSKLIPAAVLAAALFAFVPPVLAQGVDVGALLDDACNNKAAVLQVLEWVVGILGTSFGASLLSNLRSHIPAPLIAVLDTLALNFVHKAAAQAAEPTPKS